MRLAGLSRTIRPRFRLSTFLLAVGVLAVGLGWWSDHDRQTRRLREADTMIAALREAAREEEDMLLLNKPRLIRYQTVRAFLDDCFQADLTASHGWQHFGPTLQSIKDTPIAAESVPELAKFVGAPDPQVRQRAAAALGEFAVRRYESRLFCQVHKEFPHWYHVPDGPYLPADSAAVIIV